MSAKGHKSQQPMILLAEDEPLVRNAVRNMLTVAGYEVLDAADGESALEVSRQYGGSIHALITDIKMPRMNGLELSTVIVKERPGIKILMMSGRISGEEIVVGLGMDFLRKPFLPKTLHAKLSALLPAENQ